MSSSSERPTEMFSGLIIGFLSFLAFGLVTMLVLGPITGKSKSPLKSPADRVFEGDFSADRISYRAVNQEKVTSAQSGLVDQDKLAAAMAAVKTSAPVNSGTVIPGSATALGGNKPAAKPVPPVAKPKPAPVAKRPRVERRPAPKPKPAARVKSSSAKATPNLKINPKKRKAAKAESDQPGQDR